MSGTTSSFGELFRIFRRHLLESDALAVNADYGTNLWQILGVIAAPGIYSFLAVDAMTSPDGVWLQRGVRTFFAAFSFIVAAAATLFEWDMLFPDRRDFLVLTQFPIRMRDLFAAKVASLGYLAGVLVCAVNAGTLGMFTLIFLFPSHLNRLQFLAMAIRFLLCNAAAALFGFLCVAGLQGILVNVTPIRLFRRISPYVQMIGMSLMVLALVLCPIYLNVKLVRAFRPEWFWYFPPYWFASMQEPVSATADHLFGEVATFGKLACAIAFVVWAASWLFGFPRHYRRTLEADGTTAGQVRGGSWADGLLGGPQERGIYRFTGAILARSAKHRMFLACYLSLGAGLGIVAGLSLDLHGFSFSKTATRALPFLLTFFIVSGLRSVFQFPAELNANWLFQLTEADWGRAARRATRRRVLASGLAPALALLLPVEIALWGPAHGVLHFVMEVVVGLLLSEIVFWTFDRVPFTCSYFPGRTNLALLILFYLFGFTNYSFAMADLEVWAEANLWRFALLVAGAMLVLYLIWRWKKDTEMIRFDGAEPVIQALDLN